MKKYVLIIVSVFYFSCKGKENPETVQPEITIKDIPEEKPVNLEIIPGKSIGNVSLEQNTAELLFLGEADLSDAAMGKAWLTWYSTNSKLVSGKTELNIYTTYKDNDMKEKVVRQIRITSPDFKTESGICVGTQFSEIEKLIPNLDYMGHFKNPGSNDNVELYDDTPIGIAFEVLNNGSEKTCRAIIVHASGQKVTDQYLYFHPDLVRE